MKAWVVERWGSLDDLTLLEVPQPEATPGSVLVKVSKAGLNFADGIAVRGRYQVKIEPPFILGSEFAGTVVEGGSDYGFEPGDRVMAQVPCGAFAEFCVTEPRRLVRLGPGLDFAAAVALPISYTTAFVGLVVKGELKAGQWVLIHAAAGGLGYAATQVAKWRGARVIATAGSAEKCALVAANGADHVINYRDGDWQEQVAALALEGIDLVLDPIGGETSLKSLRLLTWGGRLLLAGFAGGAPASIPANHLLVKARSAIGVYWSFEREEAAIASIQNQLVELASTGVLRPYIGSLIGMEELKPGLIALESGNTTGKVVLHVSDD